MSKYYKAEDVQKLITACEWRMTLAKERQGEGFVDYSKQVLDVDEFTKRLSDLPTIEVSEDCISRSELIERFIELIERAKSPYLKRGIRWAIGYAQSAPSVVPSRADGEWVVRANGNNECSVCGREKQNGWINFCGFCGAKMKG